MEGASKGQSIGTFSRRWQIARGSSLGCSVTVDSTTAVGLGSTPYATHPSSTSRPAGAHTRIRYAATLSCVRTRRPLPTPRPPQLPPRHWRQEPLVRLPRHWSPAHEGQLCNQLASSRLRPRPDSRPDSVGCVGTTLPRRRGSWAAAALFSSASGLRCPHGVLANSRSIARGRTPCMRTRGAVAMAPCALHCATARCGRTLCNGPAADCPCITIGNGTLSLPTTAARSIASALSRPRARIVYRHSIRTRAIPAVRAAAMCSMRRRGLLAVVHRDPRPGGMDEVLVLKGPDCAPNRNPATGRSSCVLAWRPSQSVAARFNCALAGPFRLTSLLDRVKRTARERHNRTSAHTRCPPRCGTSLLPTRLPHWVPHHSACKYPQPK